MLLILASSVPLAACAAAPENADEAEDVPGANPDGVVVTLLEERIDAIAGRTLVTPVAVSGPRAPDEIEIALDGAPASASLRSIAPASIPPPPPPAAPWLNAWLPEVRPWMASPPSDLAEGAANAPGFFALLVDLPEGVRAERLHVGDQSASLRWLDAPRASFRPEPHKPQRTPAQAAAMTAVIQRLAADPFERWRARLAVQRLGLSVTLAPIEDPVSRALADQISERWSIALSRIATQDPALAHALVDELTSFVRFSEAVAAPAWAPTPTAAQRLLGDLLDASSPRAAVLTARAWRAAQPSAIAWVIDDSAAPPPDPTLNEPPDVALVVAGIADRRGDAPGIARLRTLLPGPRVATGPASPLAPGGLATAVASVPLSEAEPNVVALAGDFERRLRTLTKPVSARPPGLSLGPTLSDLTMTSWMSGRFERAPALDETLGLLRRSLDGAGWEVYIECRSLPEVDSARADTLRLWLGARVSDRPPIVIEAPREISEKPTVAAGGARVLRERDRWIVVIPIPDDAVGPDRLLRLALERTVVSDAGRRRSAWPRPMLPWQREPGRLTVDLATWGDLSEP